MDGPELDEASALKGLTEDVRDQDELERDITHQASLALIEAEDEKDKKRIAKAEALKFRLETQLRTQQRRLQASSLGAAQARSIRDEVARLTSEIAQADEDIAAFNSRIQQRHQEQEDGEDVARAAGSGGRLPGESRRDYLIRTGKITPFAPLGGGAGGARATGLPEGVQGELANVLIDAEDEAVENALVAKIDAAPAPTSHQNLRVPGFSDDLGSDVVRASGVEAEFSLRPRKKRRLVSAREERSAAGSDDDFAPSAEASSVASSAAESDLADLSGEEIRLKQGKKKKSKVQTDDKVDVSKIDDGNESKYQTRLAGWVERRSRARRRRRAQRGLPPEPEDDGVEEWFKPSPDEPDYELDNGLRLPGDISPSLFDYQKTGVRWLSELYEQQVGGIVGDEMGLGKTVQLISFLAALHYSGKMTKPAIVVAPATLLRQWVNEFHRWWPPLRVSILHSSGSGMMNVRSEDRIEDEELEWDDDRERRKKKTRSNDPARRIVDRVVRHGHVLVTTYAGIQTYGDILIPVNWGYAVLDEGHKIRNPNTAITVYCKELRTPNRIILSGTPMQNNLTELWSLFDFIYPMRLGTLLQFRSQFEVPIKIGGYANASNLQIMTAQKCAETLKDTISPYLLQRLKVDVAADLPKKSEQVLFCKLTREQRDAYEMFLKSDEMAAILNRTRQSLYGIDILRKICNHPDLVDPTLKSKPGYRWGNPAKSGKMQVVKSLVQLWKRFGHKTLLFSQGVLMLDMLESFIQTLPGINYLRMDGQTPVRERQTLVDRFNEDPDLHVFLLTTKVGGLGVNLTGANRVIIFDPDWNPSTDMQARERAWRLGQKREVTIYRLMVAGTIEEKIYHRQIFKQFLTNKVLKDPRQRATFNISDLHDLFTLGSHDDSKTETSQMFKHADVDFDAQAAKRKQLESKPSQPARPVDVAETDNADTLRAISGVAGIETYQDSATPEADGTGTTSTTGAGTAAQEARIMEGLFSRSAGLVHSAIEHENIINGRPQADRRMLQQEANKVAAQAAAHLRRAGEQARNVPIGTVTWTGTVGEAGRPQAPSRRGGSGGARGASAPSSASILAGVSQRQGLSAVGNGSSGGRSRDGTPGGSSVDWERDFESMIVSYIRRMGGHVPTKLLVDHFNQYCGTPAAAQAFKVALDRVARMERQGSSMRAIWGLREAYL